MADEDDLPEPRNVEAESRFVLTVDGYEGELVYERDLERLVLVHTGVPDELEGRGIGGVLVRAAISLAARDNLVVVPRCPFARGWLERHPEVQELVEIEWPPAGEEAQP
jgi:hypothetical protein